MSKINPKAIPYFFDEEIYRIEEKVNNPSAAEEPTQEVVEDTRRDVLIVLDHLDQDMELLEKILASVSIKLNEAEIVGMDSPVDHGNFNTILCFTGGPWNKLELDKYQLLRSGSKSTLIVDTLSDISKDVNLKKQLWAELKKLA